MCFLISLYYRIQEELQNRLAILFFLSQGCMSYRCLQHSVWQIKWCATGFLEHFELTYSEKFNLFFSPHVQFYFSFSSLGNIMNHTLLQIRGRNPNSQSRTSLGQGKWVRTHTPRGDGPWGATGAPWGAQNSCHCHLQSRLGQRCELWVTKLELFFISVRSKEEQSWGATHFPALGLPCTRLSGPAERIRELGCFTQCCPTSTQQSAGDDSTLRALLESKAKWMCLRTSQNQQNGKWTTRATILIPFSPLQGSAPFHYFVLTHTSISKNLVTTAGPHNLSP